MLLITTYVFLLYGNRTKLQINTSTKFGLFMPYQRTDLMALILVCITDGEYIRLDK